MNPQHPINLVDRWIDSIVIGLNLCPFAHRAKKHAQLRICLAKSARVVDCLQHLADEAALLTQADDQSTTLLVMPEGFSEFDDYLDLLAMAEALLDDLGYTGILQLASFHPHYQFDGTNPQDASNWTNRAPFPILHLLTESSVSRAVDAHPDPENIPVRNIEKLEQLGTIGIEQLLLELPTNRKPDS
ncbi:MAG: DUF1415 domain-containing protein [Granulosicoccus sp.]